MTDTSRTTDPTTGPTTGDAQRVAAVTGAGAGIGAAVAELLAARGYAVVVSDVDLSAAEQVVERITSAGGTATAVTVNAGDEQDQRALVDTAVETYGRLDAAVNNAGLGAPVNRLADITPEQYHRAVDVTLTGTFLGMRAQLAQMERQGSGAVVNVISIGGLRPAAGMSPYTSAKHGVTGLTEVAALDYADRGIRVNGVAPGPIDTAALATFSEERRHAEEQKIPVKRLGTPEEVAKAVAWLLSDDASFTTGAVLTVDGGASLL
ncbi:SDR family NAD(P)-dependent oxidoreductase [Corynebacterium bovis]|uniref:SDR family NAD(P)-dependent oxidoreductase n=1 Tax=Corynebacterium bovis TaxID=36808 RepID=UPI003139FFD2